VRARPHSRGDNTVFINIPYDPAFRRLYLAYICGLVHLGFVPHATLEVPSGRNRLSKILELIRGCTYSVHDLSRVQLDHTQPATPRFNMPFELGLAVSAAEIDERTDSWFVLEARTRRLAKSLSDLGGSDPLIHGGTIAGVLRELGNAFSRTQTRGDFSVPAMLRTYRAVARNTERIGRETRSEHLYTARAFRLLISAAARAALIARPASG